MTGRHSRLIRRLILSLVIAALMPLAGATLNARELAHKEGGCSEGTEEEWSWTLFEDDCTGRLFLVHVDCYGDWHIVQCIAPSGDPFTDVDLVQPLSFPTNFDVQVQTGYYGTSGGYTGYTALNGDSTEIRFRNPANSVELVAFQDALLNHQNNTCGGIN